MCCCSWLSSVCVLAALDRDRALTSRSWLFSSGVRSSITARHQRRHGLRPRVCAVPVVARDCRCDPPLGRHRERILPARRRDRPPFPLCNPATILEHRNGSHLRAGQPSPDSGTRRWRYRNRSQPENRVRDTRVPGRRVPLIPGDTASADNLSATPTSSPVIWRRSSKPCTRSTPSDAGGRARRQAGHWSRATTRYVGHSPRAPSSRTRSHSRAWSRCLAVSLMRTDAPDTWIHADLMPGNSSDARRPACRRHRSRRGLRRGPGRGSHAGMERPAGQRPRDLSTSARSRRCQPGSADAAGRSSRSRTAIDSNPGMARTAQRTLAAVLSRTRRADVALRAEDVPRLPATTRSGGYE